MANDTRIRSQPGVGKEDLGRKLEGTQYESGMGEGVEGFVSLLFAAVMCIE